MTIEIAIDPNVRVAGNLTYAGFEDLIHGSADTIAPGEAVIVREVEADLVGCGIVTGIETDKQLIFLLVDWPSIRPASAPPVNFGAWAALIATRAPETFGGNTAAMPQPTWRKHRAPLVGNENGPVLAGHQRV